MSLHDRGFVPKRMMEKADTNGSYQLPDPAALIASLLAMMTRFSCLGCPRIAARIRRNLTLLQHYPDEAMPALLKQMSARLEREWAQLQFAISDDADMESATTDLANSPIASQSLH